jgi:hypothetical protein
MRRKPIEPVLTLEKAIPVILTTSILLASPKTTEEGMVYDRKLAFMHFGSKNTGILLL